MYYDNDTSLITVVIAGVLLVIILFLCYGSFYCLVRNEIVNFIGLGMKLAKEGYISVHVIDNHVDSIG